MLVKCPLLILALLVAMANAGCLWQHGPAAPPGPSTHAPVIPDKGMFVLPRKAYEIQSDREVAVYIRRGKDSNGVEIPGYAGLVKPAPGSSALKINYGDEPTLSALPSPASPLGHAFTWSGPDPLTGVGSRPQDNTVLSSNADSPAAEIRQGIGIFRGLRPAIMSHAASAGSASSTIVASVTSTEVWFCVIESAQAGWVRVHGNPTFSIPVFQVALVRPDNSGNWTVVNAGRLQGPRLQAAQQLWEAAKAYHITSGNFPTPPSSP